MADLSGITIGITAERRADDFIAALTRHGATVLHAPTIRIVPLPDDTELRAATDAVLAEPVGFTAVTTGAGFRGWLSAAEGWGLREPLLERLGKSRIFVRGPKAAGAVRGAGLREEFSAPEESNAELFEGLRDAGVGGARVAVQLHGTLLPELTGLLRDSGADVVQAQPYRWLSPEDVEPVHDLVESVIAGRVTALAFTSAPAAANLLALAGERREELLAALRGPVLCACVGPVTAAPLEAAGVATVQPERQRLGALVKLLLAELG
ncbi:uroporphyrinogen-III synthase [Amycolatopsis pittospori]|uniref:uroporphyrinogen-III synthase n=1 Tax=Amycolatopsis pittospori TaxID=2749434 RepID=UPI0015F085D9|nr:uroporphyrinogen-III synthase [Amycolatopsis pittospori]